MKLFIGLMSGTSMDGIDAALVDLDEHRLIKGLTRPYSLEAKQFLQAAVCQDLKTISAYSQLNSLLGQEFAAAALQLIEASGVPLNQITAIGSHGQTICHDATAAIPYTVQLGCGHTIAEKTGLTVVADFRTRDLIVGGQGAPFAPIYHQSLLSGQKYPLALVNIGGIANLTYLGDDKSLSGYDLGPGNCLMDAWINKHRGLDFDKNGEWAAMGQVIEFLLDKLLQDPYFNRPLPKSIGKEYFSLAWLNQHLQSNYTDADVQATLMQFTAISIAKGIKLSANGINQLFLCGGGAHNLALIESLRQLLPEIQIESTQVLGIDPDFIEASMFAWLADKTLNGQALDLSQITGSIKPTILGAIYPACRHLE